MACPAYPHILHKITNKNCGQGLNCRRFEIFTQDWLNFKQLYFSQLFQSSARFIHKPPTAFCRANADKRRFAAQVFRRPFAYILSNLIFTCAINTSRGLSTSLAHPCQHKMGAIATFFAHAFRAWAARLPPARLRAILTCSRYSIAAIQTRTAQKPVGRILESDTCSQNKARTSLWPPAKCRIQESALRGWCCRTTFIW